MPSISDDRRREDRRDQTKRSYETVRFRVDNIPTLIRPIYLAAAWMLAVLLYFYYGLCRITSRISIEGPGNRDLSQHSIFCMWHESWWSYIVVFLRYRTAHAMISHPAAYMKP